MLKIVAIALAVLAASPATAAVNYDFTAYDFNGQSLGGFTLTTPDFLTGTPSNPAVVSSAQFDSCTLVGGCGDASFSYDPGLFGAGHDVLAFGGPQIAAIYFFAGGAFSTPGAYTPANADIPTATGRLVVSQGVAPVPEPGEWAMLAAGLAVAGGFARRHRQTA